jgi:hypothetical protein
MHIRNISKYAPLALPSGIKCVSFIFDTKRFQGRHGYFEIGIFGTDGCYISKLTVLKVPRFGDVHRN